MEREKRMNEVRLAKFETMIENISNATQKNRLSAVDIIVSISSIMTAASSENVMLSMIFDYDSCNEFAKKIMDKAKFINISLNDPLLSDWRKNYPHRESIQDTKKKINAAKSFVQCARVPQNSQLGYLFLFWSLMILTVDKNNSDDYLPLICDFAKMLKITEEEFEDIIYVIKCIYHEEDGKYMFQSESIPDVLGDVLNLY